MSSILLQKTQRIQEVATAGTVTKNPVMRRPFNQVFIVIRI
jgi:hypothetical protein